MSESSQNHVVSSLTLNPFENASLWKAIPGGILATGIGSVPHHNVDAALAFSFRCNIPYLPQLPIRYPKEFMVGQALDGLPGLVQQEVGDVVLDVGKWEADTKRLEEKLDRAFQSGPNVGAAFEPFEPMNDTYHAWQPFFFELEQQKPKVAKIQLAGPLTSQWALRTKSGASTEQDPDLGTQVFRLVLARAVAMVRKVKNQGVTPLIFIDEPGLYCFNPRNPRHLLGLQELKIFLQSLVKEGALVGLHCCGDTQWEAILALPLNILSIDTGLSLGSLFKNPSAVREFLKKGGRLGFGVIPTSINKSEFLKLDPVSLWQGLVSKLQNFGWQGNELKKLLQSSLYTPACGLALQEIQLAERTQGLLERLCVEAERFS